MGNWRTPTKKVSDVAAYVKRQFGDESGVQVTDDDIIRWVNAAQPELASSNDILQASATQPTVAGTGNYSLGNDMQIESIRSVHCDNKKLEYYNFNDYEKFITDEDPNLTLSTVPSIWAEWGGTIFIYPIPDAAYTLSVYYRTVPAVVTALTDLLSLPDRYFQRVVDYCMAQAFELDENYNAHASKMDYLDSKLVSMLGDEDKGATATYQKITVMEDDL